VNDSLPVRSTAEVFAYMELNPCGVCGETIFTEELACLAGGTDEYRGACAGCGRWRTMSFQDQETGVGGPSRIIDAGQWWLLAHKRSNGAMGG